jgi:hypothetical protein
MPRSVADEWRLLPDRVPRSRSGAHAGPMPFDAVADLLVSGASAFTYQAKRGCREAKGCTRAEFSVSVPPDVYDLLFNSSSGYRAQFYIDHRLGVRRNRELLERLSPLLLGAASKPGGLSPEQVNASLQAVSAKIWINESTSTLDQASLDAESLIAIAVPHWVACAREATSRMKAGVQPPPSTQKALLGVQAPEGRDLRVLGAWLDDVTGNELVVSSKRNRAREIRVYGFA